MLNIHLNGDIVRCPYIAEIHKRVSEIRDKHRICIYNYHENMCPAWQIAVRSHKYSGRCCLQGCDNCPGHKKRIESGHKQKTFKIDNQVYRKLASGSHYMVKESKYKTLFITLTLPPFIHEQFNKCKNEFCTKVFESEINKAFSRFSENLHNNYDVKYYIAVRERGEVGHRYHFHMLLNCKFIDFTILNNSWCSAISDICEYSDHAFTTKRKNVILRDPRNALRYCCKYFSKQRGAKSKTRLVFMSMPLILKPKKDYISVEDILKGYKGIYISRTSDYTTCFRITNNKEFARFCNQYLYALFELSDQKTDFCGVPGCFNSN